MSMDFTKMRRPDGPDPKPGGHTPKRPSPRRPITPGRPPNPPK
jgi:hypothetical protein